jgi:hypothetical protein
VRAQVGLSLFHDFERFATFKPTPSHGAAVQNMFDQLVAWGTALRALRKTGRPRVLVAHSLDRVGKLIQELAVVAAWDERDRLIEAMQTEFPAPPLRPRHRGQ